VVRRRLAVSLLLASGLLAAGAATAGRAAAAEALTLEEYFAAALARSEVIATQAELIRQAEERYRQADAARYPTVNGVASYTRQDPVPAGESSSANFPNTQSLAKVTATQPLFRGLRDIAALRQNQALVGAQTEEEQSARLQLFKDVVQNFYTVLSIEQDLRNLEAEIQLDLDREKELNARVRIGRSRIGEVLTVQSAISTLRAQVQQLQGQLGVAREAFGFLSGLDPATPLRDTEEPSAALGSLDDYLARLALRPDVKAAQQRLAAATESVKAARLARLPSVDLNANRYLKRSGALQNSQWDAGVALTVPLYTGGLLQSQVSAALSQQTQAELALSQVRRQAEQEIRALYQSVTYDRAQVQALEKATEAAHKNYEAQRHDYRLGLVTNLDVLQALTAYQENLRALDRARFTAKSDYLALQAAVMRRPAPVAP
jgi:outer membrane protein